VVDGPATAAGQFAEDPQAVDAQRQADPDLDHDSPLHELFEDQLSAADLVVLNKADLMTQGQRAEAEALIRPELPAGVKIVTAQNGALPLELLLGQGRAAEAQIHLRESHHDHEEDHEHDEFDSLVIALPVVDRERLLGVLATLVEQHTIYRIKGFAALADKPMRLLVQGVGRRFDAHFDRRWRADETPATRLVFIGHDLDEAALKAALAPARA